MFFDSWAGLLRVTVAAVVGYGALVLILRVSGKRTLAKLNAFDLVVTVALGSTLATLVLSRDVPILEGLLAFTLLVGLQWIVARASMRSRRVEQIVKAEPRLLFFRGAMLPAALRAERVSEQEVVAAIRGGSPGGVDAVEAVVLETDGSLSVVMQGPGAEASLAGVRAEGRSPGPKPPAERGAG